MVCLMSYFDHLAICRVFWWLKDGLCPLCLGLALESKISLTTIILKNMR